MVLRWRYQKNIENSKFIIKSYEKTEIIKLKSDIKKKSIEYINRITRIQQGDDVATNHNTHIVLPSIPLAYTSFNASINA